ncbi:MAG: hypothetical protein LBU87_04085 [Lactobacillales bacterium]|jgi:F-type H+-transporting ATPase subunit epsilon|nr:hypothetical protein [Lactobacillales bacterium]
MRLKVFSPIGVALDAEISKVDFEAIDGFWTLLPKHVDFINALKPGIVTYYPTSGTPKYVACNEGVLVKKGDTVSISTRLSIMDDSLDKLVKTIETDFKAMEEERKEVNVSMARLEIGLTKGLMSLSKNAGEADGGI